MFGYLYDGTQDQRPQSPDKQLALDSIDVSSNITLSGGGQYVPPAPENFGFLYDQTQFTVPNTPPNTNPLDFIETYSSITISGGNPPNFTLSAASTSVTVAQSNNVNDVLTTTALFGFNSSITLSATGQPSGITITFGTNPISAPGTGTSTMNVAASAGAVIGTYSFIVSAVGGGITQQVTIGLRIVSSGGSTGTGILITQAIAETSIAPTDAKLRITQAVVETSIQPTDAKLRITQIVIETSITVVNSLMFFDNYNNDFDQIPIPYTYQGIQQDPNSEVFTQTLPHYFTATDVQLMDYKGYSIPNATKAVPNDDPFFLTRRQPRVWIIVS